MNSCCSLLKASITVVALFAAVFAMSCAANVGGWKPRRLNKNDLVSGTVIDMKSVPDSSWLKPNDFLTYTARRYVESNAKCVILYYSSGYSGGQCAVKAVDVEGTLEDVLSARYGDHYIREIRYLDSDTDVFIDGDSMHDDFFMSGELPDHVKRIVVKPGAIIILVSALS